MDSHYHQVMKAREAIQSQETKLYFAYSTILDKEAFKTWQAEHSYGFFTLPEGKIAQAIDLDLIFDFPSRWWGGRVAGLTDKSGGKIYGKLFEIPAKDWPIVQHKEGAITGMCIERSVQVLVDGKTVNAIAFTTNPNRASNTGAISNEFIEALVRGAEQSGLPAEYISYLKSLNKWG